MCDQTVELDLSSCAFVVRSVRKRGFVRLVVPATCNLYRLLSPLLYC